MEKLIALQDINDTIKAGERFEAPDRILVALGLAALDGPQPPPETAEHAAPMSSRRRHRGRRSS